MMTSACSLYPNINNNNNNNNNNNTNTTTTTTPPQQQQQQHKRNSPSIFKGNKPHQSSGPTTTFKNWAAELQIYMSLEDNNISFIMDD
eukprot:3502532-Amphidinium_carterae.1